MDKEEIWAQAGESNREMQIITHGRDPKNVTDNRIIRVMKLRGLRVAGVVACRVEEINTYSFGEGKFAKERKDFELIGVDVWVLRTRTDLRYRMEGRGLDSSGSGW